jgi:hypothetical protein
MCHQFVENTTKLVSQEMLKPVANSVLETATQDILCQIMCACHFAHVKL